MPPMEKLLKENESYFVLNFSKKYVYIMLSSMIEICEDTEKSIV